MSNCKSQLKVTGVLFAFTVLVGVGLPAPVATAGAILHKTLSPASLTRSGASGDSLNVVASQPFDHPIRIEDALDLSQSSQLEVTAIKFENPSAVGEYSLLDGLSLPDFKAWFRNLYGTEPQAVGFRVRTEAVPLSATRWSESETVQSRLLAVNKQPPTIATNRDIYLAPEPTGGDVHEYFGSSVLNEASTALAESTSEPNGPVNSIVNSVPDAVSWAPNFMEIRVERVGVRQYFSQFAAWRFGADPDNRPQVTVPPLNIPVNWGMEFGVDVYNDDQPWGYFHPSCFESDYLAMNESFSWGVSQGANSLPASTKPYADNWEVADVCNRNAFAVGLAEPWNIPENSNGFEQVLISINAPIGTQSQSKIGGSVTLLDDYFCQVYPFVGLAQCMGDALAPPPSPYKPYRLTLNPSRNWWAMPNKCWISGNSGQKYPPALSIPYDSDGCF